MQLSRWRKNNMWNNDLQKLKLGTVSVFRAQLFLHAGLWDNRMISCPQWPWGGSNQRVLSCIEALIYFVMLKKIVKTEHSFQIIHKFNWVVKPNETEQWKRCKSFTGVYDLTFFWGITSPPLLPTGGLNYHWGFCNVPAVPGSEVSVSELDGREINHQETRLMQKYTQKNTHRRTHLLVSNELPLKALIYH